MNRANLRYLKTLLQHSNCRLKHSDAFKKAKRGPFTQTEPVITNQYKEDAYLRGYLANALPKDILQEIEPDLNSFGEKCANEINKLGRECEVNVPYLQQYDPWGNRIDKLVTCEAWNTMKKIAAEEGLIAIPYEQKYQEYSRVYQAIKLYLFAPSSGLYSCPLAMTDGAAKTIQVMNIPDFTQDAFANLTSRDPKKFWTSGQWMTEKRGGSDVASGTETVAVQNPTDPNQYTLHGYKWFSSATDADMSLTLARTQDKDGNVKQGTKGLSMFFLKVRDENSNLNGIEMHTLKNKLGTRQLPTAELLLDGTKAFKLSEEGSGVARMSSMLNITRLHNSISAVAYMRRIINLSRDYALKRKAFGKTLVDHPLHMQTLASLEVECRGAFVFLMFVAQLLGKTECNTANQEELHLLRLLTPLLKIVTAKQAIGVVSEGLENFGGQGYIEDTGLPTIFRDTQVLSIWEGTTNVLSLDVLRCIEKSNGDVIRAFVARVMRTCEKVPKEISEVRSIADHIVKSTQTIATFTAANRDLLTTCARDYSISLCRIFIATLLMDKCLADKYRNNDVYTLLRWSAQDQTPVLTNHKRGLYSQNALKNDLNMVLDGHPSWKRV